MQSETSVRLEKKMTEAFPIGARVEVDSHLGLVPGTVASHLADEHGHAYAFRVRTEQAGPIDVNYGYVDLENPDNSVARVLNA